MDDSAYPRFRLDQWTTLRLQLLWAYEKRMEGARSRSLGHYSFQSALLIRQGWADAGESPRIHRRAEAGQWLILRQGNRWQQFSEDAVVLSIGFRFQLPTGEALYDERFPVVADSASWPGLERAASQVMRTMKKEVTLGFYPGQHIVNMRQYLLAQNALRLFLIELAGLFHAHGASPRSMAQGNSHVLEALALIDRIPPGKAPTATELAKQTGLSLTHLDRLMVAETGHTLHRQLELRRLLKAQDALLASNASLKSIAYDLGFSSPSHFHHWFSQRQGMTPMEFRKSGVYQ